MRKNKNDQAGFVCKIISGKSSLRQLDSLLAKPQYSEVQVFVITDSNTTLHCLPVFEREVNMGGRSKHIEVPAGEASKGTDCCQAIWQALHRLGADRDSVVVNLGGGVVSDLGGFAASTYMRGIRYFNVPTSLLGMVDAAIGGKTGIDLDGIKNLAGTFHHPEATVIYPGFLETLPALHLHSGFAEMLKVALIADGELWDMLKTKSPLRIKNWTPLINRCAEIKKAVVECDPMESHIRKILNFGHTVGHAVETLAIRKQHTEIPHGQAVGTGMICESWLSHQRLGLHEELLGEIASTMIALFGWEPLPAKPSELIRIMRSDKKNAGTEIHFSLLSGTGQALINQKCPDQLISESLKFYQSLKP